MKRISIRIIIGLFIILGIFLPIIGIYVPIENGIKEIKYTNVFSLLLEGIYLILIYIIFTLLFIIGLFTKSRGIDIIGKISFILITLISFITFMILGGIGSIYLIIYPLIFIYLKFEDKILKALS